MTLTYRTKRRLQRAGLITAILIIVSALVWFCWVIWLQRYMVYSRDGASLNFELQNPTHGEMATPPSFDRDVVIFYNEGDDAVSATTDLAQITGYYIEIDALEKNMADTQATVDKLPSGAAVMIELKDAKGKFYYGSSLQEAPISSAVDTAAVDALISKITADHYAIAVIPAFRDYTYGLNHVLCGLAVPQGYLWADSDYCYWLDPTKNDTLNWLKMIVEELRTLGFDEVVFTDFRFPDTSNIVFSGNKDEAIAKAANNLVTSCASATFAISFRSSSSFPLPEGRSRLYLSDVGAKDVERVASGITVTDSSINLVFLTTTFDTRFDPYSVLRPLDCYNGME